MLLQAEQTKSQHSHFVLGTHSSGLLMDGLLKLTTSKNESQQAANKVGSRSRLCHVPWFDA